MTDLTEKPVKGPISRWKPGQSGNPAGRPKGAKNKITYMKLVLEGEMRSQIKDHMAEILAIAIDKAKSGDTSMIKLLIDKTMPTSKASDDDDVTKEKIQINIGRLPDRQEGITINGSVVEPE